jgi:hypothetical protein
MLREHQQPSAKPILRKDAEDALIEVLAESPSGH